VQPFKPKVFEGLFLCPETVRGFLGWFRERTGQETVPIPLYQAVMVSFLIPLQQSYSNTIHQQQKEKI